MKLIIATITAIFFATTAFTAESGFTDLFNGKDLAGWQGATTQYKVKDGKIALSKGFGGNLFTKDQYDNFVLRFEFKLEAGTNNGLAIRWAGKGDPAWSAMELQILDNTAAKYVKLKEYQYHGSIYGAFPAKRGHLKPAFSRNKSPFTLIELLEKRPVRRFTLIELLVVIAIIAILAAMLLPALSNITHPSIKAAITDWNIHTSRSEMNPRTKWHGEIGLRKSNMVFVDGHAATFIAAPTYEGYSQNQAADPDNGIY